MTPTIVKDARGVVCDIVYDHVNEKMGCSYRVKSLIYVQAEMTVLRPDGTEAVRV